MTNRERWVVYPLLAFAIMMGMRSNFQNPLLVRARSIECSHLTVGTINGKPANDQGTLLTIPMVNRAVQLMKDGASQVSRTAGNDEPTSDRLTAEAAEIDAQAGDAAERSTAEDGGSEADGGGDQRSSPQDGEVENRQPGEPAAKPTAEGPSSGG